MEHPPAEKPTFEAVYPEVARLVRRLVRRLRMAHGQGFDDVVQEALLAVAEAWPAYDPARPLAPWIGTIVRRVARLRPEGGGPDAPVEGAGDELLTPEESALVAERYAILIEMLRPMDEDRRIVFLLREVDGFTMSEVAEMLGIPLIAAHSRLRAAWNELEGRMREVRGGGAAGDVAAWLGATEEAARRRMSFS